MVFKKYTVGLLSLWPVQHVNFLQDHCHVIKIRMVSYKSSIQLTASAWFVLCRTERYEENATLWNFLTYFSFLVLFNS